MLASKYKKKISELQKLRLSKGLSRNQVSKAIGINYHKIVALESGKTSASAVDEMYDKLLPYYNGEGGGSGADNGSSKSKPAKRSKTSKTFFSKTSEGIGKVVTAEVKSDSKIIFKANGDIELSIDNREDLARILAAVVQNMRHTE